MAEIIGKAHLTEKENYLRTLRGQDHEFVPTYTFGPMPGMTEPVANCMLEPEILVEFRMNGGGLDPWGVNYVGTTETAGALLPEPGNFILDDITKWHDVIKAPSLEGIDWEAMAQRSLDRFAAMGSPRDQSAVSFNMHVGYFQNLMAFMGFEEGLCAMSEEPEEVKALLSYICDFYMEVANHIIDYVQPDVLTMMDDVATWRAPFISKDMFEELILPWHNIQASLGRERGIPITMHCCGHADNLVDDWVSIGVNAWDPAQTCNDLKGVKAKYGNKFIIMGGWDSVGRLLEKDVTEEELRLSVRESMDNYAYDGGYCWCGGFLGPIGDEECMRKNNIIMDEVNTYGRTLYK